MTLQVTTSQYRWSLNTPLTKKCLGLNLLIDILDFQGGPEHIKSRLLAPDVNHQAVTYGELQEKKDSLFLQRDGLSLSVNVVLISIHAGFVGCKPYREQA